jgi:hypothetical protein
MSSSFGITGGGQPGVPTAGQAEILAQKSFAKDTVDFMRSRAEKRIWHNYRAEKAIAAATAADVPFYEVASATVGDGNVITPRSLPEPQIMKIKAVTLELKFITSVATNDADLRDFLSKAYFSLSVNDTKEIMAWPAARLQPGCGISSNAAVIPGAHSISGWPSTTAIYWLPVPIWIKGGEQFEALLQVRAALAMTLATNRVVVEFHGPLWKRAFNQ